MRSVNPSHDPYLPLPSTPRSPSSRGPIMRTLIAWTLTWAAIANLVSQAPLVAYAQSPVVVTVDECRNLSDTDVRDRIRELASTSLKSELTAIDYSGSRQHILGQSRCQCADRPRNRRRDRACALGYELGRPGLFHGQPIVGCTLRDSRRRQSLQFGRVQGRAERGRHGRREGCRRPGSKRRQQEYRTLSSPACRRRCSLDMAARLRRFSPQESEKNLEANAGQPPVKIGTSDLVASNAASISGMILVVTRRVIGKVVAKRRERGSRASWRAGSCLRSRDLWGWR